MLDLEVITPANSDEGVVCVHCGKPVPAGMVRTEAVEQFCCSGCRTAYALLHDEEVITTSEDASTSDEEIHGHRMYADLDHPKINELYVQHVSDGTRKVKFYLEGIHCTSCILTIEKLPQFIEGVIEARANLTTSTVVITWQPAKTQLSHISRTLDRLGYKPHPVGEHQHEQAARDENRKQLICLAVAGACAGNTMIIAFALYSGVFTGISVEHATLFRWTSAVIAVVALAWPGAVFFRGAWSAVTTWTPHMDLPVALGLSAGGIMGFVNTWLGRGEVYFDSLTVLIFLLLVGRYIQFRQQRSAIDRVALLRHLTPRFARKVHQDSIQESIETLPIEAVEIDDILLIRAGDIIPADGVIESGNSSIDRSILTGESEGIPVSTGDTVPAGSKNLSAPLRMRVQAVGHETRLGKIMDLVEVGTQSKTPIVQFANRIGGYFVVVVTLLAFLTAALWWSTNVEHAINNAMALLIVACPCALGLATPLTLAVAQGRAAKNEILIKSGDVLEQLARPGMIWLDKTGTITEGQMKLQEWYGDDDAKAFTVELEKSVVHPLATAIICEIHEQVTNESNPVQNIQHIPAMGITGEFNGRRVAIGNEKLIAHFNITSEDSFQQKMIDYLERGWTPLAVCCGQHVVAVCGIGDAVRSDAKETVSSLKEMGWTVGIISGDHPKIVESVARQIGIAPELTHGGVSPEEKLKIVQEGMKDHAVVMVGDGVNDSAALAAASVGIAVHGGAETSLQSATVYLDRQGLTPILELMNGSSKTVTTIHRNFFASISYNIMAVVLAMGGMITPLIAAVLMPISSLTVLTLAMCNQAFKGTTA